MKKYKARFTAEAIQIKENNLNAVQQWLNENDYWSFVIEGRGLIIDMSEATMARIGSYLVKIGDTFYIFSEDNFKKIFKEVKNGI